MPHEFNCLFNLIVVNNLRNACVLCTINILRNFEKQLSFACHETCEKDLLQLAYLLVHVLKVQFIYLELLALEHFILVELLGAYWLLVPVQIQVLSDQVILLIVVLFIVNKSFQNILYLVKRETRHEHLIKAVFYLM